MTEINGTHNYQNEMTMQTNLPPMPGGMDLNAIMGMMGQTSNPNQMMTMITMMMLQMLQQMMAQEENPNANQSGSAGSAGAGEPTETDLSATDEVTDHHHCCPCPGDEESGSAWEVDNENKTIKLDNGYELQFSNASNEWTLTDEQGRVLNVWGDPHVDENGDGSTDWDFKRDSTFVLDDGTKITVGTKDIGRDDGMTVSDTLTITKDDQAIEVSGIAHDNVDISEVMNNGDDLDTATNDGFVFFEGADGVNSWYDSTGQQITENQAMGPELVHEYDEQVDVPA